MFDPVGGPTVAKLAQATARLGILFLYGALEHGADPAAAVRRPGQVDHDPRLRHDGNHERSRSAWNERKAFINEGLADGSLKPIIARTFPLEEIVEAHRYLESNQQIGKIVVTV